MWCWQPPCSRGRASIAIGNGIGIPVPSAAHGGALTIGVCLPSFLEACLGHGSTLPPAASDPQAGAASLPSARRAHPHCPSFGRFVF